MSSPVTTLRLLTKSLLESIPTFGARVYDSRTTPLAETDVPCLVVFTPGTFSGEGSTGVKSVGWPPVAGERDQEMRIFAEFNAADDAALGAAADDIEHAIWSALHRDGDWCNSWKAAPSWSAAAGRDARTDVRRCTVAITLRGPIHQDIEDPTGLVRLDEIRATMTDPDGNEPGYTGPAYTGRVFVNPDPEA